MPQNPTWSSEVDLGWSLNHVGLKVYYSFNYQYYLEYLLFLIPLVFLFYRIVKIHFRCESTLSPLSCFWRKAEFNGPFRRSANWSCRLRSSSVVASDGRKKRRKGWMAADWKGGRTEPAFHFALFKEREIDFHWKASEAGFVSKVNVSNVAHTSLAC